MISAGRPAPLFRLPNQNGQTFDLGTALTRRNVMLLFLPAAFTPICTTELPAVNALASKFISEANTMPVAITVDNTHANLAWSRQCGARGIDVLSDFFPHGAVSQAYGVLAPDGVSERSTVIIGQDGRVKWSEVAGRFGKRSAAGLLALAKSIYTGGPIVQAAASVPMRLDLPVLYMMDGCGACAGVITYLNQSGVSQRVVQRDISKDQVAAREFALTGATGTPALVIDGKMVEGTEAVINALEAKYPNG